MKTHFKYPTQLTVAIDVAAGQGAILIERRGIIQMNFEGCVILIAYRSIGIWFVEFPGGIKVAVPVSEVNALPASHG